MKNRRNWLRTAVMLVTLVMAVSLAWVPVPAEAKAASIKSNYKTIRLKYSSHINSRYFYDAKEGLQSIIKNKKKSAVYTAVVRNKKVAKTVKNTWDPDRDKTIFISTGVGTTKADIYEKRAGAKKKTKIGTVSIKVKKAPMADVFDDGVFLNSREIRMIWLKMNLGEERKTCNIVDLIHNRQMNINGIGLHFKKSEYSFTYSLTGEEDIVDISENGQFTAKAAGNNNIFLEYTFSDGSASTQNIGLQVTDTVLHREGIYNIDNIRDSIIGLNTPVDLADGTQKPMINFDNAATTPAFRAVQEEVDEKLEMYGSIGRGASQKSNFSTEIYNNTRDKVLDFVGADPEFYTCFYVNNTTDGLNKLASALVKSKKDLVLATRIEHHANDLSWRERCKVVYAEVDENGRVRYSDIKSLLKKYQGKIKYVTVTAASNVTGYVTDVHKVAKLAHQYGAKIIVDGAQIVAHRKFSMLGETDEENIDFFVFSAHKMYSPYGGGAVVGLSKVLNKHMPTFYGGGTIKIVADAWQSYKEAPARYEAGSPNYPGVVGLGKAIDILNDVGFDDIQAHEKALNRKLIDGLKQQENVIVYGDTENIDDRVGVVTFNFTDINSALLADQLAALGAVATRRGAFCAHPYVWRLMGIPDAMLDSFENCTDAKTPGMVRVSFGIYNTEEEVDEFLAILPEAMARVKAVQPELDVIPEY